MCTDLYGRKYATTNYGMLYTAKGVASLLAPLALPFFGATRGLFVVAALLNILAALMALIVLKPLRKRVIAQDARFD
jgi:OFA family oxalate/formate antiporter-like MFS transporter